MCEAHLAGQSDDTETYYRAVLSALESLLDQAHAISGKEINPAARCLGARIFADAARTARRAEWGLMTKRSCS